MVWLHERSHHLLGIQVRVGGILTKNNDPVDWPYQLDTHICIVSINLSSDCLVADFVSVFSVRYVYMDVCLFLTPADLLVVGASQTQ